MHNTNTSLQVNLQVLQDVTLQRIAGTPHIKALECKISAL
jgi:hypothetical protein